ncbi:thioredoxin family protein [Chitinibacter tainanensis]|uniref:thioredoxin family protein n=1 Tax=Chitinibacter tainanensis TaxID=230667 RepID=UPI0004294941|nr:thioredoxin family protein [Chitinibacter tainanensis]
MQIKNQADFDQFAKTAGVAVLKVSATFCGPCKQFKPIFDQVAAELAREDGSVRFGEVEVDTLPEPITEMAGVRNVPALIIYADGQETERRTGIVAAPQLGQLVRDAIFDAIG